MAKKTRAARRRELKGLVEQGDVDAIVTWARQVSDAPAMLVTRFIDRDDRRRWTATVALARVLEEVAATGELETIRVIIRRLLWNMMEESGGLAWHGPEAIAEILVRVPVLQPEYGRIVAAYIDEEPFEASALYLIGRLAPRTPEQFEDLKDRITDALAWPDPFARAHALRALAAIRPNAARKRACLLLEDHATLPTYDAEANTIGETSVAAVAGEIAGVTADASSGPESACC